jgi:hypothetical protein
MAAQMSAEPVVVANLFKNIDFNWPRIKYFLRFMCSLLPATNGAQITWDNESLFGNMPLADVGTREVASSGRRVRIGIPRQFFDRVENSA